MRTVTYSWRFYKYKITGQCKCSECGKKINKTFSFDYREDTIPNPEYIEKLKKEKQEWEQESHICNSCLKKKIKQERKDITETLQDTITGLNTLQKEIQDKIMEKQPLFDKLKEQLYDKVIIYNDNEYVVNYIHDGSMNGNALEIYCDKVNKTKPWEVTSNGLVFYKKAYSPCHFNNFVEIENCIITDEVFSKRKDLL